MHLLPAILALCVRTSRYAYDRGCLSGLGKAECRGCLPVFAWTDLLSLGCGYWTCNSS